MKRGLCFNPLSKIKNKGEENIGRGIQVQRSARLMDKRIKGFIPCFKKLDAVYVFDEGKEGLFRQPVIAFEIDEYDYLLKEGTFQELSPIVAGLDGCDLMNADNMEGLIAIDDGTMTEEDLLQASKDYFDRKKKLEEQLTKKSQRLP